MSEQIIQAGVEDLPALSECAREFYASSKFLKGFDLDRFCTAWEGLIGTGVGAIFILCGKNGAQGAIGGVAYPDINSGELQATEFFWFVRPDSRGGGLRLYRKFEEWARTKGCRAIHMGYLKDSMPEKVGRIYERLGFEAEEVRYVKELT